MSRRRTRRIRIDRDEAEFAEHGWFSCPNKAMRDTDLSIAARWAFGWMMSNQTGFSISAEDIAEAGGLGIHAAEDLVYELEAAGWLTRHYTRSSRGYIDGIDYKLKPYPVSPDERTAKPRKERAKRPFPKIVADTDEKRTGTG